MIAVGSHRGLKMLAVVLVVALSLLAATPTAHADITLTPDLVDLTSTDGASDGPVVYTSGSVLDVDDLSVIAGISDAVYGERRFTTGMDTVWVLGALPTASDDEIVRAVYIDLAIDPNAFTRAHDILSVYAGDTTNTVGVEPLFEYRSGSGAVLVGDTDYDDAVAATTSNSTTIASLDTADLLRWRLMVPSSTATLMFRTASIAGAHFAANYSLSYKCPAGYQLVSQEYLDDVATLASLPLSDHSSGLCLPIKHTNEGLQGFLYFITGLALVANLVAMTLVFRASSWVRTATVPRVSQLIASSMVLALAGIFFTVDPLHHSWACDARPWPIGIGATIIVMTLVARGLAIIRERSPTIATPPMIRPTTPSKPTNKVAPITKPLAAATEPLVAPAKVPAAVPAVPVTSPAVVPVTDPVVPVTVPAVVQPVTVTATVTTPVVLHHDPEDSEDVKIAIASSSHDDGAPKSLASVVEEDGLDRVPAFAPPSVEPISALTELPAPATLSAPSRFTLRKKTKKRSIIVSLARVRDFLLDGLASNMVLIGSSIAVFLQLGLLAAHSADSLSRLELAMVGQEYVFQCRSTSSSSEYATWLYIELAFACVLLLAASIVAWRVRALRLANPESKALVATVAWLTFFATIGVALNYAVDGDPSSVMAVRVLFVSLAACSALIAVAAPKVTRMMRSLLLRLLADDEDVVSSRKSRIASAKSARTRSIAVVKSDDNLSGHVDDADEATDKVDINSPIVFRTPTKVSRYSRRHTRPATLSPGNRARLLFGIGITSSTGGTPTQSPSKAAPSKTSPGKMSPMTAWTSQRVAWRGHLAAKPATSGSGLSASVPLPAGATANAIANADANQQGPSRTMLRKRLLASIRTLRRLDMWVREMSAAIRPEDSSDSAELLRSLFGRLRPHKTLLTPVDTMPVPTSMAPSKATMKIIAARKLKAAQMKSALKASPLKASTMNNASPMKGSLAKGSPLKGSPLTPASPQTPATPTIANKEWSAMSLPGSPSTGTTTSASASPCKNLSQSLPPRPSVRCALFPPSPSATAPVASTATGSIATSPTSATHSLSAGHISSLVRSPTLLSSPIASAASSPSPLSGSSPSAATPKLKARVFSNVLAASATATTAAKDNTPVAKAGIGNEALIRLAVEDVFAPATVSTPIKVAATVDAAATSGASTTKSLHAQLMSPRLGSGTFRLPRADCAAPTPVVIRHAEQEKRAATATTMT